MALNDKHTMRVHESDRDRERERKIMQLKSRLKAEKSRSCKDLLINRFLHECKFCFFFVCHFVYSKRSPWARIRMIFISLCLANNEKKKKKKKKGRMVNDSARETITSKNKMIN